MYSASRVSTGTNSPTGLIVMSQKISTLEKHLWRRLELEAQDVGGLRGCTRCECVSQWAC
jgi:hypothetical protein